MAIRVFIDDPETEDTGEGDPPIVDMGAYEYQGRATPPLRFDVIRGVRESGELPALIRSDDERLVVSARRPSAVSQPSVQIVVEAFAPTGDPAHLLFTLEASATVRAVQWIDLFDFDDGR